MKEAKVDVGLRPCIAAGVTVLFLAVAASAAQAQQNQPSSAPSQPANAAGVPQVPPLTYSKWTKLCDKNAETRSRMMCRIGRDGRLDNGVPLVAAVLIEIEGEPRRVLQVTLPVGVMLPRGTRVLIDDDESAAVVAPFMVCTNSGCLAQMEVDANAIARMRKGKSLHMQAFSMQQAAMTLSVPLAEFSQAYDGPPADPKQVEEQNRKLAEEFQKKQQQATPPAPPAKR